MRWPRRVSMVFVEAPCMITCTSLPPGRATLMFFNP